MDPRRGFADLLLDLQHHLLLVVGAEAAQKCAVLHAVQAVVEAEVGDPGAHAVVGDVIDEKTTHLSAVSVELSTNSTHRGR